MKRHQTAKYKKRQKKERANRKARQQVMVSKPSTLGTSPEIVDRLKKDMELANRLGIKLASPARRAFQGT